MGTMMEVKYEITEDILIARLSGELDHHSAADIREDIDAAIGAFQAAKLILSFDNLTFMDSAGIGVVMGRYNRMKEKGGKLFLAGGSDYVRRILGMAGVYTLARHYETVEDVIKTLKDDNTLDQEGGDWNDGNGNEK